MGARKRALAACGHDPLRQQTTFIRARAEGGGCRVPDPRRGRRALDARRRARARPRAHDLRLHARGRYERLQRAVASGGLTGVLLVGGGSSRFGSPKPLARLDGETLAARAWRTLGAACGERIAVGKRADALALPFDVVDDESVV